MKVKQTPLDFNRPIVLCRNMKSGRRTMNITRDIMCSDVRCTYLYEINVLYFIRHATRYNTRVDVFSTQPSLDGFSTCTTEISFRNRLRRYFSFRNRPKYRAGPTTDLFRRISLRSYIDRDLYASFIADKIYIYIAIERVNF